MYIIIFRIYCISKYSKSITACDALYYLTLPRYYGVLTRAIVPRWTATTDRGDDGKAVAELKGGDFFGEMALLRQEPRAASILTHPRLGWVKLVRLCGPQQK